MPIQHSAKPFWVVLNFEGNAPTFRHESEESAVEEAERLARLKPDYEFYVLKAVCAREFNDLNRIAFEPQPVERDEIPF